MAKVEAFVAALQNQFETTPETVWSIQQSDVDRASGKGVDGELCFYNGLGGRWHGASMLANCHMSFVMLW